MNLISSPLRASNLMNLNKHIYKSPGGTACNNGNNASPGWRDAYKKRCFDDFKSYSLDLEILK